MLSFLPNSQTDGCDLASQGQTSHLWLHSFRQQTVIEIMEWAGMTAGPASRSFEHVFQIMIVVAVEATQLNWLLAPLQLSFHGAVLRTIVGLQPKTAVGPQLSLGSETKRSLDQRGHESSSNRTDRRNLPQQLCRAMFPALLHQISSYRSMQSAQGIEFLVEELGPTAHPNFLNLVQPFRTVTRGVNRRAGTSNGPAAIERLDSIHNPGEIFADRQITAPQFLQGSYAIFSMVDRPEKSAAQQFGQFSRIDLVTLAALFQQRIYAWVAHHHLGHARF